MPVFSEEFPLELFVLRGARGAEGWLALVGVAAVTAVVEGVVAVVGLLPVDELFVEPLWFLFPEERFIDPNKLLNPTCPTPPKSCINCCWDMLFSMYCNPSSVRPPDPLEFADGGLLMASLIRRQKSSSFSVSGSCIQKNSLRCDDLNFKR